jgi:putative tricarboxylic transport membrane protein
VTTFDYLMQGFGVALTPINLFWCLIGCTLGTAVGVLPGIGPALTITLLLPAATLLSPTSAFIIFAGIVYGAMYGGSTTSILINTPGEAGSMITALEGNQMARRGKAGPALATAAIGSFVAGTIATVMLSFAAPAISELAFLFGPADYFALTVLAFTCVSVVMGTSVVHGFIALFVGLAFGVVGLEFSTGQGRMTFGMLELMDGIQMTIVLVALFAVGEILYVATRVGADTPQIIAVKGAMRMSRTDWSRSWKPWLRGTAVGFPIGALPAGGSEIPTLISYAMERRLSKHPEEFGKGAIEGVAGPEAANNAAAAGMLVPLLTLGLPTSATAAIMLAAFQNYGLQPGPTLFTTNPELVWGLISSLYIGNAMLLVLNLPLIGLWVRLLYIPRPHLYAGILVFALCGVWGIARSPLDLLLMALVGVIGYVFRVYSFPIAPVLIGLILGPFAEVQLRRALQISQGDWLALVSTQISGTLILLSLLLLVGPPILRAWHARKLNEAGADA